MERRHHQGPDHPGRPGRTGFLSGELHRSENAGILTSLRAAILGGLRPTTILLGKQPYSKWNHLDRTLFMAYRIYEDEIVKDSGLPYWITRNIDPEIILEIEERDDRAAKLLAEWDKKHGGDAKKLGVSRFVAVRDAEGKSMEYGGLTRQLFQQAAIQEERDLEDELGLELEDRPEGGYNPADYGDGVTDPE